MTSLYSVDDNHPSTLIMSLCQNKSLLTMMDYGETSNNTNSNHNSSDSNCMNNSHTSIDNSNSDNNTSGNSNNNNNTNNNNRLEMMIVPTIYAVAIVGGCIANGALITLLCKNRRQKYNSTGILVLNLAIADLLFLLFWVPFHTIIYTLSIWPFGDFMCRFIHYMQFSSMFANVFTLTAMAVNRYVAIRFPIWTRLRRNHKDVVIISLVIWIVALCLGIPSSLIYTTVEYQGNFYCTDSFQDKRHLRPTFFLLNFLIGYVIPLSTILILSTLTVCNMWNSTNMEGINAAESLRNKRRATKIVISLVLVFACMWFPYHLFWIWVNYFHDSFEWSYAFYYFQVFAYLLAFTNSALNPLVYAFCSETFRKKLCIWSKRKQDHSLLSHSRLTNYSIRSIPQNTQEIPMDKISL
ncbi:galanin receptor 2b [Octopus bimaculoides]|uniref:G-protein coupled receptors family 1 profile domain-containing protein n=1 Tax=Octopus bimaculoides TaxID=37653 RepID=A0A0L8H201_OCTBM|nr:galanin receptor 2b [Octopus bimaculoides]|eukprot:XP_014776421.1 PREDICTED: galanin receptor type 1-like [Octopus bimaculoides]